jgi:cell division protein FtsZ
VAKNLRFTFTDSSPYLYKIKIIGVGGGGGNMINTMLKNRLPGVSFVAINTDRQALLSSYAPTKIQIGRNITKGLGSGGNPSIGKKALEETQENVKEVLKDMDVLFIVCGMGGGTGTGASPEVAKMAKERGSFIIGVVTFPFKFEGKVRTIQAEQGIRELKKYANAVIVMPNQELFSLIYGRASLAGAFEFANQRICEVIRGITGIINYPGLINVDFADVCGIMSEKGETFVGIGKGKKENGGASKGVEEAINSSKLIRNTISKATGILVNFGGGANFTMDEVEQAMNMIYKVAPNAHIIFGVYIDEKLRDEVRVTLIVTGDKQYKEWREELEKEDYKIPAFKRRKRLHPLKEPEKYDIYKKLIS